ncbi:hypothetical protein QBE52_02135 [Clostridiaceae bacterium 35-E11]
MKQWIAMAYAQMKELHSIYVLLMSIAIGLYCLLVDYQALKKKKLKKEAKICQWIGLVYIVGGIGLYVIIKIF